MIDAWRRVCEPRYAPLVEAAGDADDAASIERLRRDWPSELVQVALQLAAARRKAATKFPDRADALVADPVGVEQATSQLVARHKAKRFAALKLDRPIVDLCCGIGGDTMSLAPLGVVGVDVEPLRTWMTGHNARCDVTTQDVTDMVLDGSVYHIDPSRRDAQRRRHAYGDYQPGPAFIERLIASCPTGAIKLGPGVEVEALPGGGEVEFVSEHGTLVQAVMWRGELCGKHSRTATRLPYADVLCGEPNRPPIGAMRRYLLAVDPAVERAQLMGELCEQLDIAAIHPQLGLLTSEEPINSTWLTPFELIAEMPWRPRNPRRVKQWLDAHGGGIVEVKTRGKAVDTDAAQKQLRGKGDQPFTVFVLRWDRKLVALVTRRVGV